MMFEDYCNWKVLVWNVTGSHHVFKREGIIFVIPVHANRGKSSYVRRVIELIESKEK
jgi:predicted RNA binding protein YcfA (HicA-like mRNA interferase family)